MIACILSGLFGARLIEFSSHAPEKELALGRALYRSGVGPDRTLMVDRNVLGTWYDGRIRRAVDTVTWVSPELVARWLGYEAERESWPDEVVDRRWQSARAELDGNLTFIVRLAAFPRLDPFEFGIGAPPKSDNLSRVKFTLGFVPHSAAPDAYYAPTNGMLVASTFGSQSALFEMEKPEDVTGRPFFSLTKYAYLFLADGEVDPPDDGIPLGDYYGAVYTVTFPYSPKMRQAMAIEFGIRLRSKREVGKYDLYIMPKLKKLAPDSE